MGSDRTAGCKGRPPTTTSQGDCGLNTFARWEASYNMGLPATPPTNRTWVFYHDPRYAASWRHLLNGPATTSGRRARHHDKPTTHAFSATKQAPVLRQPRLVQRSESPTSPAAQNTLPTPLRMNNMATQILAPTFARQRYTRHGQPGLRRRAPASRPAGPAMVHSKLGDLLGDGRVHGRLARMNPATLSMVNVAKTPRQCLAGLTCVA